MILLDTDVLIDVLRKHPAALEWLKALGGEEVGVPGFVMMELVQGCRTRKEAHALGRQFASAAIVWRDEETCNRALETYRACRFSHGTGMLDCLVGELAVALGLPLHTFNQKHYSGIGGLTTVQPYQRSAISDA